MAPALPVAEPLPVPQAEGVSLLQPLDEGVPPVPVIDVVALPLAVLQALPLNVDDCDPVGVPGTPLEVGVPLTLPLADAEAQPLSLMLAVAHNDCNSDTEPRTLSVAHEDALRERVGDPEAEGEAVHETLIVNGLLFADMVAVAVSEMVADDVGEGNAERDAARDHVGARVSEGRAEASGEVEPRKEREGGAPVSVGALEAVAGTADSDALPVPHALKTEALCVSVVLLEALGQGVCKTEGLVLALPLLLSLWREDAVGADGDAKGVAEADVQPLALACGEADGVNDSVALDDSEGVLVEIPREAVTLEEICSEGDAETQPDTLPPIKDTDSRAEDDASTERGAEPLAQSEALGVYDEEPHPLALVQ